MKTRILSTILLGAVALAGCREEIIVPVDPPLARKDLVRTAIDTPVIVDMLANDHDPNGEALTLTALGVPTSGSIVQNPDSTVTFTPAPGFTGGASFTYIIQDASGNQVEGAAHITVGDSTRLLYRSNVDDFYVDQMYLADSAHPDVVFPLSGVLPLSKGVEQGSADVQAFGLTPDRGRVAYFANAERDNPRSNLFVVDVARPGVATQLTDIPDGRAIALGFPPQLSPDGTRVFFIATLDIEDKAELYMMEVDDPASRVAVNFPLAEGENVISFVVGSDGNSVLYVVTRPLPDGPDEDTDPDGAVTELYVTTFDQPGTGVKLNGGPPADGTLQQLANLALSPDQRTVAFASAEDGSTTRDLYIADYVAQTPAVKIGGTGVRFGISDLVWSRDGTFIVYRSDQDSDSASEIFMVRLATPDTTTKIGPTILNPSTGDPVGPVAYALGPDDTYVLYVRADLDANVNELFRVDIADPGVSIRMNAPLLEDQGLGDFRTTPAQPRRLLYSQDALDEDGEVIGTEIMLVDVDSPGVATKVGSNMTRGNIVRSALYSFDPTGTQVLYRADPDEKQAWSIQMVELAAPTEITRLTSERIPGAEVKEILFLP